MTASPAFADINSLIGILRVLVEMDEERTHYNAQLYGKRDFSALAVQLLIKDLEAMGEPAELPDPRQVARVEEELLNLFNSAAILGRAFTSLVD